MGLIEELMDKLGVSQRVLAILIGADHSHLSRYRASTRTLPTSVFPHLSTLYQALSKLKPTEKQQPSVEELKSSMEKAAWCRVQCAWLKNRLETVNKTYQQADTLLQVLSAYEAAQAGLPEKKQRWIEEQRYQAEKRKVQNGWAAQRALQINIALLQWEAELNEMDEIIKYESFNKMVVR